LETIEKEPSYARVSAALFYPMMAYERLVNSYPRLGTFRVNILGVLQKPSGPARLDAYKGNATPVEIWRNLHKS
jgi:hypothetical protein